MTMEDLIARMQRARSAGEAGRLRLLLEARFLPNQVLQSGAAILVERVVDGLLTASGAGVRESWELLSQLAAGASPPTFADPAVVEATQDALRDVISAVSARVDSPVERAVDFLAVDVLDAVLTFVTGSARAEAIGAIWRFAARGDRERRRGRLILEDIGPDES
ncbi:hypothetical protein [Pseudofrankia asymbiotica]|uniref:Uncharacterized protein n=1 Tax=Pseudofrankia asymbiotica TaxID=1834516 RepID=A0A1V2I846_9ACTN|nr:hypothetical protein [Pseudofrankia asymbiotica]ONH28397.1 hypothetical protein BL253_19590 [Pseudofrankia asymbiotica]